jgi:hypothetical protein
MGNKPIHFKNFTLPDVSLNQNPQKLMKILCSNMEKKVNIDPKFMYKILNLKTQNYVQIGSEPTVK